MDRMRRLWSRTVKKLIYLHGQKEDPCVTHIDFPTGEKHIRIRGLTHTDEPILFFNDPSGDVMKLGLAVDICRRANVRHITLVMPFVPYARQDRVAAPGDPFSIKVFAKFVNSLGIDRVVITDPHSDVTPAVIDNSVVVYQHEVALEAVELLNGFVTAPIALVAPDLGASKKIKALQTALKEKFDVTFPIIQCDKTRCVESGRITGFKVLDGNPEGHYCLQVDDICDGGGTFLGLANVIAERKPMGQALYVTHGIFSKGVDELSTKFQYLFASNSFPTPPTVHTLTLGAFA